MSQRLNSKGVQNKITDFYHLAADSKREERERERLTKDIKNERGERAQKDKSSLGGSQHAASGLL